MEETLLNEQNMKINMKKTKVFVCSKNRNINARIYLKNNHDIDQVEKFAYSRCIISEDGRCKREIINMSS